MAPIDEAWRELYRCGDLHRARSLATTIAAMEFDVECAGSAGVWAGPHEENPGLPPYVIRVRAADHPHLADVLHEMIAEQAEFDARLAAKDRRLAALRTQIVLIALAVLIIILTMLGALRL